jgi:hypothetical protein
MSSIALRPAPAIVSGGLLRALALFALLLLGGCQWLPDAKDETADWSAERLYSEANAALR